MAQVEGLTWYTGAISNAEWEGVALKDVLGLCTLIGFSKNSGFGMALGKNLVEGGWNLSWPYPVTNFHV